MACVSNLGTFANWTGHVLAGANTYGFGRLAWDPTQAAEDINREWAQMTFPSMPSTSPERSPTAPPDTKVVNTVVKILSRTREVYEGYTSPLGIGFIVFGGGNYKAGHGACAPATPGPGDGPGGQMCPSSPGLLRRGFRGLGDLRGGLDHYWVDPCSNYGCANYSRFGLGCDRTSVTGTGYAGQYAPSVRDMFDNVQTCPTKLLLWFHNLAWDHQMTVNGETMTLFDHINQTHVGAVQEVKQLAKDWLSLYGMVDSERFHGVAARFAQQVNDAAAMSNTIMGQYTDWAKLSMGRVVHGIVCKEKSDCADPKPFCGRDNLCH